jgi:hypothetical protein
MPVAAVAGTNTMRNTMPVDVVQRAAEAAMDRAAKGYAIGSRYGRQPRTAIPSPDKTQRDRANGGTSHCRQHDAA